MNDYYVGMIILFGNYPWRILDIVENKALIITDHIIMQKSYHDTKGDITWSDCALRTYLNHDFYLEFTPEEQDRIIPVLNENRDNQWYGTTGGKPTKDYIFLLSIEQAVCKYFGDSRKILENRRSSQKYWFSSKDIHNSKRQALFRDDNWWWWLRSSGRNNRRAAYIHGDGNVGIQGNGTYGYKSKFIAPSTGDNLGGVRPALWLKIL